jgi:hypothetical protein
MAEFESVVDYSTKLDNFDGPLDLLLFLIKEAKIDITEIFVSQVTEQYLAYINSFEIMDVDKVSEYLIMAAKLLEIKSKSVLPLMEDEAQAVEDDKQNIYRQLEEYKLFKEVCRNVFINRTGVSRELLTRLCAGCQNLLHEFVHGGQRFKTKRGNQVVVLRSYGNHLVCVERLAVLDESLHNFSKGFALLAV